MEKEIKESVELNNDLTYITSELSNKKYDLFISYRRKTGWYIARLLYERLSRKGLNVFLDIDELHRGDFSEAILKHIENSKNFAIILTPGDLKRCSEETDWVRKELEHAFKCGKPILPITTAKFTMPDKKDLPSSISSITTQQCFEFNNNYYDTSMDEIEGELKGIKIKKTSEKFKRQYVEYHQTGDLKIEWHRLHILQKIEASVENPILDEICSRYESLRVLAVGAHDGVRVVNGFINRNNLERLVMTESSQVSRPENERLHKEYNKINIYPFHMSHDSYMQNLEKTLYDNGNNGKKYNVAVAWNTLLCGPRLLHVFECISNVMEPGGTIFVTDIDDGLQVDYPDKNNYFAKLNQIRFNLPWSGNRYTGRQIYGYLKRAGFENIKLCNSTIDNSCLSKQQRWELFKAEYGRVKDDLKRLIEKVDKDNQEYINDYKWLIDHWDEIEMEYLSDDFFSCYGYMIWTATKKKD